MSQPVLAHELLSHAIAGGAAAIRVRTRLQPAGGPGDEVFPATLGETFLPPEVPGRSCRPSIPAAWSPALRRAKHGSRGAGSSADMEGCVAPHRGDPFYGKTRTRRRRGWTVGRSDGRRPGRQRVIEYVPASGGGNGAED